MDISEYWINIFEKYCQANVCNWENQTFLSASSRSTRFVAIVAIQSASNTKPFAIAPLDPEEYIVIFRAPRPPLLFPSIKARLGWCRQCLLLPICFYTPSSESRKRNSAAPRLSTFSFVYSVRTNYNGARHVDSTLRCFRVSRFYSSRY